jgi:hypothetical protein
MDYTIEHRDGLWAVFFTTYDGQSVHLGHYSTWEHAKAAVSRHEKTGLHYTQEANYQD